MLWINISTSFLRAPEFIGAEPVERATWLNLIGYCCDQENGGRVAGCRQWGDRRWMQTCGVTRREVEQESTLWEWDGDDLIVFAYPAEKEAEVRAKRKGGAAGGKASGESRRKAAQSKESQVPGKHESSGEADSEAVLEAGYEAKVEGFLERKGKEGNEKGMEGRGNTREEARPPSAESPPPSQGSNFVSERWQGARGIGRRIMGLRRAWGKPAALTAVEMHEITGNLNALESLTDDDWQLLGEYLNASVPQGAGFWQPHNRSKFIEAFGDVLGHAQRWAEKKGRKRRPTPAKQKEPEPPSDDFREFAREAGKPESEVGPAWLDDRWQKEYAAWLMEETKS